MFHNVFHGGEIYNLSSCFGINDSSVVKAESVAGCAKYFSHGQPCGRGEMLLQTQISGRLTVRDLAQETGTALSRLAK